MSHQHGHFQTTMQQSTYQYGTPRLNPFSGGWTQGAPWAKRLIIINIAIWLVMILSFRVYPPAIAWWTDNIAFTPSQVYGGKIWQIITSMFMHSPAPTHVFINMLIFYIFGPRVERDKGSHWFIRFYLVCGIGGSILSLLGHTLLGELDVSGAGASGAVLGIVAAYCIINHSEFFWLFWAVPVRMLYIFYFILALELAWILAGLQDGVDHYAHVGGMLTALILLKSALPLVRTRTGKKPRPTKAPRLHHPSRDAEKPSDFLEV